MRCVSFSLLLLAACGFPEIDTNLPPEVANAPYPILEPLPPLPNAEATEDGELQDRIDALQSRAEGLRQ